MDRLSGLTLSRGASNTQLSSEHFGVRLTCIPVERLSQKKQGIEYILLVFVFPVPVNE